MALLYCSRHSYSVVKDNPQFDANRCRPFCCDVTSDSLTSYVAEFTIDMATMIFCLSAIHPSKMVAVLQNIHTVSDTAFSKQLEIYFTHYENILLLMFFMLLEL